MGDTLRQLLGGAALDEPSYANFAQLFVKRVGMWAEMAKDAKVVGALSATDKEKARKIALNLYQCLREPEFRMTLDQAIDKIVKRLYVPDSVQHHQGLAPLSDMSHVPFNSLRRRTIVFEALLAAGKTSLIRKFHSVLVALGYDVKDITEDFVEEVINLFYSDMEKYAYATQLFFTRTRSNANSMAQAHVGREPTGHKINPATEGIALVDRSALGDILFALINYLSGRMTNAEFAAVLASTSPNFTFDVLVFLDVSAKRAKFVAEVLRKRPSEKDIPLEYLEKLRLVHYALVRRLVGVGASVLFTQCDDDPLEENRIPFLDAKEAVHAVVDCPSSDILQECWEGSLEPSWGVTTEAQVSEALALVRERQATHKKVSSHVKRITHVKASGSLVMSS